MTLEQPFGRLLTIFKEFTFILKLNIIYSINILFCFFIAIFIKIKEIEIYLYILVITNIITLILIVNKFRKKIKSQNILSNNTD